MTRPIPAALHFLALLTLVLGLAQAAPPSTINYQGYLTNAGGTPVTNPAVAMTFSLFTAQSGGSPLWSESQSVAVTGGVFNAVLGTGSLVGGSPLGTLAFDVPYYLEITAGGETLSPRTALTSSPYAFRASNLAPGATVEGVVPPGYMIIGTTTVAPPGFDFVGGLSAGYYLFVRQGNAGQAIQTSVPALTVTEGTSGQFNVTLAMAPPSNVTVLVNSFDTQLATVSPPSLTFSPANFSTPQPVTVTGIEDVNLSNDGVIVLLGAAGLSTVQVSVTVNDNDSQEIVSSASSVFVLEGGTNTFGVKLSSQPVSTVTVNVASSSSGVATASPTTLTFNSADYDSYKNVTVTGTQDVNLLNESTTVNLTSAGLLSKSVTVNVTDDDTQAIVRSTPTLSVAEGGTNTFGVSLGYQPASTVTVNVASNNTAVATVSPSSLSFTSADYDTPKAVTVTGTQDMNLAIDSATINLTSPGASLNSVTVNVIDDDVQAIQTNPASLLTINEGSSGTIQVRLAFQPASSVTVNFITLNPAVATTSVSTLTFTPANYNTYQPVTVNGVSDANLVTDSTAIRFSTAGTANVDVGVTVNDTGP